MSSGLVKAKAKRTSSSVPKEKPTPRKSSQISDSSQAPLPGLDFKKQLSFGGSLLKRSHAKTPRPLSSKQALHIVLRSDHATGKRSFLLKDRVIQNTLKSIGRKHGVKIYRVANSGNHLHLLVRFTQRRGLQNFLRGSCGIIARKTLGAERGRAMRPQLALREAELSTEHLSKQLREKFLHEAASALVGKSASQKCAPRKSASPKTKNALQQRPRFTQDLGRFWTQRPFTRIVSWGKDFERVLSYLKKNTLEALGFVKRKYVRALSTPLLRSRVLDEISSALGMAYA